MKLLNVQLAYMKDNKIKKLNFNTREFENEEFSFSLIEKEESKGRILSGFINPKEKVQMKKLVVSFGIDIWGKKMITNGYQSWSETKQLDMNGKMKSLNPILKPLMNNYGDYTFANYSGKEGKLHSHLFAMLSDNRETVFFGGLNEKYGYNIFYVDLNKNEVSLEIDVEDMIIAEKIEIMKVYHSIGEENEVFEHYCKLHGYKEEMADQCTGWTSWYNYYTDITEEIILNNLENISKENIEMDIYQIDDGYQKSVGDWLETNEKFPDGMRKISDEIHVKGYKAGLWLAPFVCEKKSDIYKEHKDWILKDKKGKLVQAGWTPLWSGKFFALDIYNEEVREYLRDVFTLVLNEWNFDMVKLDFLYAVAIIPQKGKSRGAVMYEAMDFLRELVGDKIILGCGVPLGASFNKVDYCRIGADVALQWEDERLKKLNYKERVSTHASLHNTIWRNKFNGKFFLNDPDVFILRDENNKLTRIQKETLFLLNNLLGGLVFFSDDVSNYSEEQMRLFKSMFPKAEAKVKYISCEDELYNINYDIEENQYVLYSNLSNNEKKFILDKGLYFCKEENSLIVNGNSEIILKPYESKQFVKIIINESEINIAGTKGHLFPKFEIDKFEVNGNIVEIKKKDSFQLKTEVILISKGYEEIKVNGEEITGIKKEGYYIFDYSI